MARSKMTPRFPVISGWRRATGALTGRKRLAYAVAAFAVLCTFVSIPVPGPLTAAAPLDSGPAAVASRLPSPLAGLGDTGVVAQEPTTPSVLAHLPYVAQSWPPIPYAPTLSPIDNADYDKRYTVDWSSDERATSYELEEANDPGFTDARIVFEGPTTSWSTPSEGGTPRSYYYRVRATNAWGTSASSDARVVTVYPVYVGLRLRFRGTGFYSGQREPEIGYYYDIHFDQLVDPDTLRMVSHLWYDPNPYGFEPESWFDHISATTGGQESTSRPDDSHEWHPYVYRDFAQQLNAGDTVTISGQRFRVSGPKSGRTAFDVQIQYWELVNIDSYALVAYDFMELRCLPGDATLRYDAGGSKLLIHQNLLGTYFFDGEPTTDTWRSIIDLLSTDSIRGGSAGLSDGAAAAFANARWQPEDGALRGDVVRTGTWQHRRDTVGVPSPALAPARPRAAAR